MEAPHVICSLKERLSAIFKEILCGNAAIETICSLKNGPIPCVITDENGVIRINFTSKHNMHLMFEVSNGQIARSRESWKEYPAVIGELKTMNDYEIAPVTLAVNDLLEFIEIFLVSQLNYIKSIKLDKPVGYNEIYIPIKDRLGRASSLSGHVQTLNGKRFAKIEYIKIGDSEISSVMIFKTDEPNTEDQLPDEKIIILYHGRQQRLNVFASHSGNEETKRLEIEDAINLLMPIIESFEMISSMLTPTQFLEDEKI